MGLICIESFVVHVQGAKAPPLVDFSLSRPSPECIDCACCGVCSSTRCYICATTPADRTLGPTLRVSGAFAVRTALAAVGAVLLPAELMRPSWRQTDVWYGHFQVGIRLARSAI